MRDDLFFKFNKIIQGENNDENLYDNLEYQMFLNLEKNSKRKKLLNKFIFIIVYKFIFIKIQFIIFLYKYYLNNQNIIFILFFRKIYFYHLRMYKVIY